MASTGLSAIEFREAPLDDVLRKIGEAARKLANEEGLEVIVSRVRWDGGKRPSCKVFQVDKSRL